ncbi:MULTISPECIES: hypothetical protein [Pseudomonas]|uniref:hypothetical protein n=1 Tax=Pseudomonas TaxID=286 RepID=UPI00039CBD7C|nr:MULTISPECIES: hypothetical protein [Pseudomonas]ELS0928091.1 hypothetical protein [Pseudomonas putida]UWH21417.1 hypothetical protein KW568_20750 [Pseudomonas sp. HD6515]HDS0939398.1 hypothetical protein [Pseudomonas putida]
MELLEVARIFQSSLEELKRDYPLLIDVGGMLRRARRTRHIQSTGALMEYERERRFAWT